MFLANNSIRIKIIAGIAVLLALSLVVRLYFVQIVNGAEYKEIGQAQYVQSDNQLYNRGSISLTAKDGTSRVAALQESGYILAVNAQLIDNVAMVYTALSKIIDINENYFMTAVADVDDPYIEIASEIPEEAAIEIQEAQIRGVGVYPEKWRRYPYGPLAAHVLGYAGYADKGDQRVGTYGIEKQYDSILDHDGGGSYLSFPQVFSGIGSALTGSTISRDGSVLLTLEPDVQSYLERLLSDLAEEWNAPQTMGIVMDPNTGAIRAMAVHPTFNPNTYNEEENVSVFTNPTVQSRYEMGSIIKALTMAAGLDAGVVTPETTYVDKGSITLNNATIYNYDGKARGRVNMQEVLNQSLNTGASYVALELGHERMRDYFYRFGLGEKTGIKLPGEIAGAVSNLEVDRDLAYATASFGQGIALTPVATIRALATLANGGRLVQPHVVDSIDWRLGGSSDVSPEVGDRVLKQETSEEISRMLVKTTDEALAGGDYSRERHSVAAKTGTAQIAQPGGGYYDDIFNHTFFGYFPAYDPEFIVFLMVREPQGVRYASQTLTDPFFNMVDFLINYYNIAPDR
ncbi:MAG: penicillin-binding protein 2 [Candidatus Paceibacterota bacterium]